MTDFSDFRNNGYILKRNLFSKDEVSKLISYIDDNSEKEDQARETFSSTGKLNITLWNQPSDDLFGKFSIMLNIQNILFIEEKSFYTCPLYSHSLYGIGKF